MSSLPQVSSSETADLRDVHKRLTASKLFSYWQTFSTKTIHRVYPWIHSFWPRWF